MMKKFFGKGVYSALEHNQPVGQMIPSALALLAGEWMEEHGGKLCVLFPYDRSAAQFANDFLTFRGEIPVFLFAGNLSPFHRGIAWKRFLLCPGKALAVFSTCHFHYPLPDMVSLLFSRGMQISSWDGLLNQLLSLGLERKEYSGEPGTFRVLGDSIYIWGLDGREQILTFEGNRLEEIEENGTSVETSFFIGKKWTSERWVWEVMPSHIPIWIYEWDKVRELEEKSEHWIQQRNVQKFHSFIGEDSVPAGIHPLSFLGMERELLKNFLEKMRKLGVEVYLYLPAHSPCEEMAFQLPVEIRKGSISEGFFLTETRILLLSETDILGKRMLRALDWESRLNISSLQQGDLLVHETYGIGKFIRIQREITGEGEEKDYILLEYQDGDRLLVPVEQWDRLHPYWNIGGGKVELSKLGSKRWLRQKEQVRRAAFEVARQLHSSYLQRQKTQGIAYPPDTDWQKAMEEAFPYAETPDQIKVTMEVKRDMESVQCMDRLICGDVGYGKTEVAVRAAFKAVMGGYQVVVMCPTTILAYQHRETFRRRLESFGVEVEMVSRLRTPRENQETLKKVREGKIDILIGTHRLLQPDVEFARLGLVIIDEEQRFGVLQKERWKWKYPRADVLTLTATPIPRTMYMALTPLLSLSLLRTPPVGRLTVVTHIGPWNKELCFKSIERELQRGGQVFYLINRIAQLKEKAHMLSEWFPHTEIDIAHGKMQGKALEKIMENYIRGKTSILVSTAIIENGIDIPNADTLIVEGSERFGLADLHQLRGRVGRGSRQAYAYFFFSDWHHLTETARQRLKILSQSAYLGAGFDIARKDLELRGAGNILGTQQHGWISQVGFTLYARLFSEAFSHQPHKKPPVPPPLLRFPISAYLPESLFLSEQERLKWYEDLVNVRSMEEIEENREELKRYWGALPKPVESLLDLLYVKLLAEWAEVEAIEWKEESQTLKISSPQKEWEFRVSSGKETLLQQIIRFLEDLLEQKNYSAPFSASSIQRLQSGDF
ncbi:MAG: helicase-related protein [bacterium JZ-2024 1]